MNRPFKVLLIFLFFFCYYHPSEAQIPASGLVAYYPFNGNANDESGNGNDGTVNGATLTVDRFGKSNSAYNLYGNDLNKITLSPFTPPSIITISLWFNPVDAGPTTGLQGSTLFSNTEKFVNHDQVAVWMSGGVLTFYISNAAGTGYFVASNSYISLNKWHHLVCTIDDQKQLKMYINNELQTQTATWSGSYIGQSVTNIGNNVNDDDNFNGTLDDVKVYNRALSSTEVYSLYHENGYAQLTDIDDNVYETVKIGTQEWMKENLKTTKYNDGSTIPYETNNTSWINLSTPAYCWYNNDESANKAIYGALYNWFTVNTGKLCPAGWHVPSSNEWTILGDYLGGSSTAGGKMKETGTTHWSTPNSGATDESGFKGLPGGQRWFQDGSYVQQGIKGLWWTSSEYSSGEGRARVLLYDNITLQNDDGARGDKNYGFSVRCLKDDLAEGLVAYYPFNGNANDESGNGLNGTNAGAILATDRFGNANSAYSFYKAKIVVADNGLLDFTNSYSLCAWVKSINKPDSLVQGIIGKALSSGGGGYDLSLTHPGNLMGTQPAYPKFGCGINNGSGGAGCSFHDDSLVVNWHFIVATYDGSLMRFYLDGIRRDSVSTSISLPNSTRPFYIGRTLGSVDGPTPPSDTVRYFYGKIDDVRLYNRALSNLEIKSIYHENGYAQVTDIDGNIYGTVTIGSQTWMQKNLRVTRFNDGAAIPNVTDDNTWDGLSTPAYAFFNNDIATYKDPYGGIYNWFAVNTGKLCPAGWHVPSDDDWHTLVLALDPSATLSGTESATAGGKMKETGTEHWGSPNTGATNESGFTAVAAGTREDNIPGGYNPGTNFEGLGLGACFWTSTEYNENIAWYRNISKDGAGFFRLNGTNQSKRYGYSVRCLKDANGSPPVAASATSISQTSFSANWSPASGATGYYLDVAIDNLFTSFVTGFNNKDVSNVTTYSVTGLSANTAYYYRLRAYGASGTSTNSNIISVTTLINPPSAPAVSSATSISQTGFDANWSSSSTATGYYLDVATSNTFSTFVSGYNNKDVSNVTTYTVTGLTANTAYYYRVRAYNAGGTSPSSNTITTETLPAAPPAPVASSATSILQTSFLANWVTSSGATGYYIDISTDNTFASFLSGYNNKDVSNVTSYSVTGLTASTTYYFRIRAYNTGGTSLSSNTITTTTSAVSGLAAPVATAATSVAQTSFSANWSAVGSATGYYLDVATDNTFLSIVTGYNNKNVLNVTNFTITGLSPNTTYYFRVSAYNGSGTSANSNVISTTTLTIAAPSAPVAIPSSSILQTNFAANWNSSSTATGYYIDVSTDNSFSSFVPGYNNKNVLDVTSYIVTGLSINTTYYLRVRAYNTGGTSPSSNVIITSTLIDSPVPPTATTATSVTQTTLTVNWNSSATATGYYLDFATDNSFITFVGGFNSKDVLNVTNYAVTGLTANTNYYYRVRAYNTGGTSSNSNTITAATLPVPSSVPVASVAGSIMQNSFIAVWNGVSGATGYNIDVALDNSFTNMVTGYFDKNAGNVTSYSVTGLTDNTTYYYRIRAYNTGGTSASSNIVSVTTLPDIPAAPSANSASSVLKTGFTANWSASLLATGYYLDISTINTFATFVTGYNNLNVSNNLTYSVTGLTANTTYYYRLRAFNSSGTSTSSNTITVTTLPEPPSVPAASTGTSITQTNFSANWASSSSAAGYYLDVSTSSAFTSFVTGYENLDVSNVLTFSVTGLTASTTYYFRIRAYNTGGSSASSNTITVTTLINPPSKPAVSSASSVTQTSMVANWSASATATGYRLDVSTSSSFSSFVSGYNDLNVNNVIIYSISGLTANTTYYYRVRAYNAGGTSPNSDVITRTTLIDVPPAPVAISATSVTQTGFTTNWNSSTTASGYYLDVSTNNSFTSFVGIYNNLNVYNLSNYTISGLSAKTTYYYRLKAYNAGGNSTGYSNTITVTTLPNPPASPTGLSIRSCNDNVELTWTANTEPSSDFLRYRIYGGTSSNPTTKIDSTATGITNITKVISGLVHGQKYYFKISAVLSPGVEGNKSSEVSVTVKKGFIPKIIVKWGDVLICNNTKDSIKTYLWYRNNTPVTSGTKQFYYAKGLPGSYKVESTDKDNCRNFSNIIAISTTKSISVYPNPAGENITVEINDENPGTATISILSQTGTKLKEFSLKKTYEGFTKDIPVSDLDEGVYFIQVVVNQVDIYYSKIIVVK